MKKQTQKRVGLLIAIMGACLFFLSGKAHAATINVTAGASDVSVNGNCSIHEAVESARTNTAVDGCASGAGADVINLPDGVYDLSPSSVNLNLGHDTISIIGESRDGTIIDGTGGYGIDYGGGSGAISITLSTLTIRNTSGLSSSSNTEASLTITNTLWHNNETSGNFGIVDVDGDNNAETLEITDSILRDNTGFLVQASSYQGFVTANLSNLEIYNNVHASGNSDNLFKVRVTDSIDASDINYHDNGGGIELYANDLLVHDINFYENTGASFNLTPDPATPAMVTAYNIAIVNNEGIGALTVVSDAGGYVVDMYNITIAGNATNYPGLFMMSDETDPLSGTISNITIANNTRTLDFGTPMPAGFGIFSNSGIQPTVVVSNMLLANNIDDVTPRNCVVGGLVYSWVSGGHNLSTDGTCAAINNQPTDLQSAQAALGTIVQEGGTWVVPLLEGSSAIDAGLTIGSIPVDQRGTARPQGGAYDIGAYEYDGISSNNGQPGTSGGGNSNVADSSAGKPESLAQTGSNTIFITLGGLLIWTLALTAAKKNLFHVIYRLK